MTDNILRIRTLIDRFFDGETTLDEEQQLYAFFSEATSLPDDLEALRPMFRAYDALQSVSLATQQTRRPVFRRWWLPLSVAAGVTVLLLGGAAVLFTRHASPVPAAEEEFVAYIYGERTTDPAIVMAEMQTTMVALQGDGSDVVKEQLKAMFDN
jgi:hypothetical protein